MIAIIDLDLGNLYSVKRAFEHLEADIVITDDAEIIKFADKIVLAGVGSYKTGMESIAKKGLYDVISYFAIKKPVLGICLGMQMLMDSSQENGGTKGLGLISGNVRYFNDSSLFVPKFSVPNMGWIDTRCNQKGCFNNSKILTGISEKSDFYFVHSLFVTANDENNTLLFSKYGGVEFSSMIRKGNIIGCQFHPEKSGKSGLKIIQNFINL